MCNLNSLKLIKKQLNRSGLNYDVWMVRLQKEDWEKTKTDRDQGDYYVADKPKKDKKEGKDVKKKDKKPAKKKVAVKIDEDRLYERLVQTRLTKTFVY